MSKPNKKHDLLCARNFAIFGAILLTSFALMFGPIVIEYAPLHVKVGLGLLFCLVIALYVGCYLDIHQHEE